MSSPAPQLPSQYIGWGAGDDIAYFLNLCILLPNKNIRIYVKPWNKKK